MPLNRAKSAFEDSLQSIEAHTEFYATVLKLRMRSSNVFSYDRLDDSDKPTVRQFSGSRVGSGEMAFEVLYASICFHYEHFIRELHKAIISEISRKYTSVNEIKPTLLRNHIVASGRVLSRYLNDPRAAKIDVHTYAKNIVSCAPGNTTYELNTDAFVFSFGGASTEQVQQLFQRIGWDLKWDEFGQDTELRHFFKGGGTREVAKLTEKFIDEFVSQRNRIVHRGDGTLVIGESTVRSTATFFRHFARTLTSSADNFCNNYLSLAS